MLLSRFKQILAIGTTAVVASFLVYRGHVGGDPTQFSLIVPVMCILTAFTLCLTVLAIMIEPPQVQD